MKYRITAAAMLLALSFAGCSSDSTSGPQEPVPSTVNVSPGSGIIEVGESLVLTASVVTTPVSTGFPVDWSTSDASVATVTGGTVTGIAQGSATITARAGVKSTNVVVQVTPAAVTAVTTSLSLGEVRVGQFAQATAVMRDRRGAVLTGRTAVWSSSNPQVATVNAATGVVLGVSAGNVSITATSEGATSGSGIIVSAVPPVELKIAAGDAQSAAPGTAVAIAPSVTVTDSAGRPLAGVNVVFAVTAGGGTVANGTQLTNASGTAVAGAWTLGPSAGINTLRASVTGSALGVSFNATALESLIPVATCDVVIPAALTIGLTAQATATPRSAAGVALTGRTITWTSLDTNVATISAGGSINAIAVGTARIRVSCGALQVDRTIEIIGRAVMTMNAGNAQTAFAGSAVTIAPSVIVRTAAGAPLAGVTVTFTPAAGSGSVVDGVRTTNEAGIATVGSWTLGATGSNTLTVTAPNVDGSPVTFTATGTTAPPRYTWVGASVAHTCAQLQDGVTKCWGTSLYGRVGDGNETGTRPSPTTVAGGRTFQHLAIGALHTCGANATNGRAYCWGSNANLALGWYFSPIRPFSAVPVPLSAYWSSGTVDTLSFSRIAAGNLHSCGVALNNRTYCWGQNDKGQLGNGGPSSGGGPVLTGTQSFSSISAAGRSTCGLTQDGAMYCWGNNEYGILGDGTIQMRVSPTRVQASRQWRQVTVATDFACAIAVDNNTYCWGRNDSGQLGDNTFANRTAAAPIAGNLTFVRLAENAHSSTMCGLIADGTAYCWGSNESGALGSGDAEAAHNTPRAVAGGHKFSMVTVGEKHGCGLTLDRFIYCWGGNALGQLGIGTYDSSNVPVLVR